MNIFRFIGDMAHLLSFLLLLWRLKQSKSAAGISLRSQELYLLVFVTRYLDLFTNYYSLYNSCMKVIYITASAAVVYVIRFREPYKTTYDAGRDTFPHWKYLVAPLAVLSLFVNDGLLKFGYFNYVFEIFWSFSIYLEAVAIIPQLLLLQRLKEVENITSHYVFALGSYRFFYILNWIYRWYRTPYYRAYIAWFCGVVQTGLFADFFYHYVKSKSAGLTNVPLPQ